MIAKLGFFLILSTLMAASARAQGFKAPDVLVSTRLDYDWSAYVVKTVRSYMKEHGQADPFSRKFSEPLVVNESVIDKYLDDKTRLMLKDLGKVIGLNIVETGTKVTLLGLKYKIEGLKAQMNRSQDTENGAGFRLGVSASELSVSADALSLAVVIPGKNKSSSPILDIRLLNPEVLINRDDLIKFSTLVNLNDGGDHFKLSVPRTSFDSMADALVKDPSAVQLQYELEIPQVSVKIGNKTIDFSKPKLEALIRSYEPSLKRLLLAQIATLLTSGTIDSVLKITEKYRLEKKVAINSDPLMSFFNLTKFSTNKDLNTLDLSSAGDFCLINSYVSQKDGCAQTRLTKPARSRVSSTDHEQSLRTIEDLVHNSDAALVASVSEDYINRLLVSTYDAGYWAEPLADAGVALGSNMMKAIMNQPGQTFKLVLDVVHRPKRFQRLAIGSPEIRFPLIAQTVGRIENRKGVPHIVIQIVDVDISDETLLNGDASLGIVSNLNSLRFKKKVLAQIKAELVTIKDKVIFEMAYDVIKGLKLEAAEFMSDGSGRLNAVLNLKSMEALK